MKNTIFTGAGVAIITPMNADGSINYDGFAENIEFQIANGTDAIIVCGTTGEASTMTDDEHIECIRFAVEKTAGRIPVIAGTGSNDTKYAVELSKIAQEKGADGLLLVTPYYNKASQKGLVAVKEASGNISYTSKLIAQCGDLLDVYSGNDDIIVPMMSIGAKGVISVISNIMPKETHEITQLCLANNCEEAAKLQMKYLELINNLFIEVNPIPIKEAMNQMKMPSGPCRLPLCEMTDEHIETLKNSMKKIGLI